MSAVELVVDLSPMLINRTAVRTLGQVVGACLAERGPTLQYFGERFSTPPGAAEAQRLRTAFTTWLAGPPGVEPARPRHRPGSRTFFIDPLYVLFAETGPQDLVMVHDLSTLTHPEWHGPGVDRRYRLAFDRILSSGMRIIPISRNTADAICANFGYPRRPLEVLPLFVPKHVSDAPAPRRAGKPYLLFVGSLERRKNVAGLIAAYDLSGLASQGCELIIVGGGGQGDHEAVAAARAVEGVRLTGFVSDEEMAGLYQGACGFAYPSYLEGFGVPLLEALHHGLPALASLTGASPEVGGDLVAYCDPDDHAAIAQGLRDLFAMTPDARADHAVRARAWVAERFSVEAFEEGVRRLVDAPAAPA